MIGDPNYTSGDDKDELPDNNTDDTSMLENTRLLSQSIIDAIDPKSGLANIHRFAIEGNCKKIVFIVNDLKGNVNVLDGSGKTALHHAFLEGKEKVCQQLIALNADHLMTMPDGKNIAHIAVAKHNKELFLFILNKFGKELFFQHDHDGYVPIHYLHEDLPSYHFLKNLLLSFTELKFIADELAISSPVMASSSSSQGISRVNAFKESLDSPRLDSQRRARTFSNLFYSPKGKLTLSRLRAHTAAVPHEEASFSTQIKTTHTAHIKKTAKLLDQTLIDAGLRKFKTSRSRVSRNKDYQYYIRKYVFGKVPKDQDPIATSSIDITLMTSGILQFDEPHLFLKYICNKFERLALTQRLFSFFFVKELILGLQVNSTNLDLFRSEFDKFIKKISNQVKFNNKVNLLIRKLLTELYNQKISLIDCLQTELRRNRRNSLQLMLPESIEDKLNLIAAGRLSEDEYILFVNNLSNDMINLLVNNLIQITPKDLFCYTSAKIDSKFPSSDEHDPVKKTIHLLNNIGNMVIRDILSYDLEGRLRIIKFYVDVANYILKGNQFIASEYNLFMNLAAGLISSQVTRLKQTQLELPNDVKQTLVEFESLVSPSNNFKNLRQKMTSANLPVLAHLTKDILAAQENTDIEFRLVMVGRLTHDFFDHLQNGLVVDFSCSPSTDLRSRLEVLAALNISDEQLYTASYKCEAGKIFLSKDASPRGVVSILETRQPELVPEVPSIHQWRQQRQKEVDDEMLALRKKIHDLEQKNELLLRVKTLTNELTALKTATFEEENERVLRSSSSPIVGNIVNVSNKNYKFSLKLPLKTPSTEGGLRLSDRTPRFVPTTTTTTTSVTTPFAKIKK